MQICSSVPGSKERRKQRSSWAISSGDIKVIRARAITFFTAVSLAPDDASRTVIFVELSCILAKFRRYLLGYFEVRNIEVEVNTAKRSLETTDGEFYGGNILALSGFSFCFSKCLVMNH